MHISKILKASHENWKPIYVPKTLGKNFSLWDKLVLFIFALILFDSTEGFDTNLNSLLIFKIMSINFRPQEILIVLAVLYVFINPRSITVLIKTTTGCLLLTFFLIVIIWTCVRIYEGESTNALIRVYLGWIGVPLALCIVLQKWENVVMSFYITLIAGIIGAAIMGATVLFGVGTMNLFFPHITQPTIEAHSAHVGFYGQSYAWIPLLTFYVTANVLLEKKREQRFKWIMPLIYLLGLDVITMGRGRFVFNIFYLLFGLTFIAPVLGIHFRTKVKTLFTMSMATLVISILCLLSGIFTEFGSALKSRYSAGTEEILTKSGSFFAHYLTPFERFELLKNRGLIPLLIGVGPRKESDAYTIYRGDIIETISTDEASAISSDSTHATLLGWYGLSGLILMTLIGIACLRKYLLTPNLDSRFKYVGAIGSVAFILSGMFVAASANALETNTLIVVWAVLIEYYSSARIGVHNETNLIRARQNPAVVMTQT